MLSPLLCQSKLNFKDMATNLDFLRSQCPSVTRPKLLFFEVFDNIKSQKKTMRKRLGNNKLRKSGNGNVFRNLIKIVFNIFGENKLYFFFQHSWPRILKYYSSYYWPPFTLIFRQKYVLYQDFNIKKNMCHLKLHPSSTKFLFRQMPRRDANDEFIREMI